MPIFSHWQERASLWAPYTTNIRRIAPLLNLNRFIRFPPFVSLYLSYCNRLAEGIARYVEAGREARRRIERRNEGKDVIKMFFIWGCRSNDRFGLKQGLKRLAVPFQLSLHKNGIQALPLVPRHQRHILLNRNGGGIDKMSLDNLYLYQLS